MFTLTFTNEKGGVGKTTLAVETAVALTRMGYEVLLLDVDHQQNAGIALAQEQGGDEIIAAIENGDIAAVIRETGIERLRILPSTKHWATVETRWVGVRRYNHLRIALRRLGEERPELDYAIVDTPPSLGTALLNALMASDGAVIPVEASPVAVIGLESVMHTIREVSLEREESGRRAVDIVGIVPTRVDERTRVARRVCEQLAEGFPDLILPRVREAAVVKAAYNDGTPVMLMEPAPRAAEDFAAVAAAVAERTQVRLQRGVA